MEAHFLSLSKDIQENQLPQEEPSFDSQSERMEPFMLGCDTVADTDTKAAAPLFPHEQVKDFKHVVYNLLALHSNDPVNHNLVRPIEVIQNGVKRKGFQLDAMQSPETVFAELYARYIRGVDIHNLDKSSPIIQDLYKYYSRSAFELLVKYFEKKDKYTYLYPGVPLFEEGDTLEIAEQRIKNIPARSRKKAE